MRQRHYVRRGTPMRRGIGDDTTLGPMPPFCDPTAVGPLSPEEKSSCLNWFQGRWTYDLNRPSDSGGFDFASFVASVPTWGWIAAAFGVFLVASSGGRRR